LIEKGCFFIGHADAPSNILPSISDAAEELVCRFGVNQFFVGNHGNFDRLAQRALIELKSRYTNLQIILVTPYHPAVQTIKKPEYADEVLYPFEKTEMPQYAISKMNRKMIDECRFLIVYADHVGKARDFLEYAVRREKKGKLYIQRIMRPK